MVGILVPGVGLISRHDWNLPDLRTGMAILCCHFGRPGCPLHFDFDVSAFNQPNSSLVEIPLCSYSFIGRSVILYKESMSYPYSKYLMLYFKGLNKRSNPFSICS